MTWDAIVVGARCAGSPLARFLARAGKRVLLVDAAPFPSDQPLSTHFIQPYGMRILDELGLGDRVRAIAPPVTMCATLLDEVAMRVRFPLPPCCIRRVDLDHILVDGAREAGAELALQHRVVEVLREGERVAGVVTEDPAGTRRELRASVVVGADGRHSTVAKLVGAEKYFHYEGPRAFYWAYWPRPAWYGAAPYEGGSYIAFRDQDVRLVFPVNRDQMLLGIGFPREQVDGYKADPRGALEAGLSADPFFGRLIAGHEPIGKVIGVVKPEYFFRAAAGPGWALVGDAGLHKDPTPGLGIADALRDAKNLAAAIVEGSDAARERYWRQRDVDSFELFNFARDMGELDYNNALSRIAVAKLAAPARVQRVIDMVDRKLSPYAVIKPTEAIAWTFGALLRGRFGVLKPFFKMGKRQAALMKELERRRALLVPALPSRSASERVAA